MNAKQRIFVVRRDYNQWVNNQTLEDYALRFTAKKGRRWSLARVANTALGAISFLALEAIGGAVTLNYGFSNAMAAVLVVGLIIFFTSIPICYYAAKYGVDIDLLTRGAGFGYIGSTATSLIYASFTFIFFALEAAIMAVALELLLGIPLVYGYVISSVVVIPMVTHGITFISRFQLWSQPLWIGLQLTPFAFILYHDMAMVSAWPSYTPSTGSPQNSINLAYFGAAASVLFALIAQIGEQVDFLRFLPPKTADNRYRWWTALLAAGPGWIVIGTLKIVAGSLLAFIALQHAIPATSAADPTSMYRVAFAYLTDNPQTALILSAVFVIISQLKINVTNAYAGSIAWSNFFSRLTHSHPGRVVWLVFNVAIALMLMELGIYQAFEHTLGVYAIIAVGWVGALVADLIINKPLGLSPPQIEFKRAHLYDINPVGVGAMVLSSIIGILCYTGLAGEAAKALSHFVTLGSAFVLAPMIAYLTDGRYYIARQPIPIHTHAADTECIICQNHYEPEDMAFCPAYDGAICSLCCSLDARCQDMCKDVKKFPEQVISFFSRFLPDWLTQTMNRRFVQFSLLLLLVTGITGLLMALVYTNVKTGDPATDLWLANTLWKIFLILVIVAGVISWLFVLAHESRVVAQEESQRQNRLLVEEIEAHTKTDRELQRAKEQAEAANNAKSRYLTGISHELRTPLNAILGYAQLLENDQEMPPAKRNQVSVIKRSGEHLADLIEGLLDISKIEAGRLQIHRDQVRVSALMDQLVYMFRLQAEERGLTFSYHCESRLPTFVTTDEKRLRQILINLLSNAIKFTEQGEVALTLKYKNQVAEFQIRDSGVGIPEEEMERIFKPFERVRRPGMPNVNGTGLGLAIVQLLTDIMGGEVLVKNNPEGGVTFTLWLMLAEVASPQSEIAPTRRIYGYHGPKRTIMVVDDDASHRGLISDILSPLGFIVLEAPDGETCLSMFHQCQPDLYLMDISMPGANGWQVSQGLREQGYKGPIIMVSANASEVDKDYADTHVHNDYVVKPVKIDTLLDKLSHWLSIAWCYAPTPSPEEVPIRPPAERISPLSNQVIEALIGLIEIGHLSELKREVEKLESQGAIDPTFMLQMNQWITNIQFEPMLQSLRSHYETNTH